jgi:RimJ/RimL family protein N-acetyltransferase
MVKKKKEMLKTERLVLRPFHEADRQEMVCILCDKEIKKTYMIPDFTDKKEAEALFERIMNLSRQDNHFVYGIFLDDKLIGFVNDCEIKDATIELGYVIAPNYQGKGFATEAVQCCIDELFEMGFAHVRAGFFEENMASCRVMQKCGMHKIDLEEDIEYKGILHHCLYYEIDRTQA